MHPLGFDLTQIVGSSHDNSDASHSFASLTIHVLLQKLTMLRPRISSVLGNIKCINSQMVLIAQSASVCAPVGRILGLCQNRWPSTDVNLRQGLGKSQSQYQCGLLQEYTQKQNNWSSSRILRLGVMIGYCRILWLTCTTNPGQVTSMHDRYFNQEARSL